MKLKLICGLIISILSISIFSTLVFADAPPPIPTEYWGRLMIDGQPAPDGTEVKYWNGEEWTTTTTLDGWYNIILTGGDSPLTYNDDPDCSTHWANQEACIPCTQNVDCVEGPQQGDTVQLVVNDKPVSITWGTDASGDETVITTYHFVPGWNLFSLPALPKDTSISYILEPIQGKYSAVWAKLGANWKSSSQPFSPLTDLALDQSYYIYITDANAVDLAIEGNLQDSTTINLVTGWNLVGYPRPTSDSISNVLSGVTYDVVWTKLGASWKSSVQPFSPLVNFVPGGGYFVYTGTPGSYIITT
jgi:hypothetical protein